MQLPDLSLTSPHFLEILKLAKQIKLRLYTFSSIKPSTDITIPITTMDHLSENFFMLTFTPGTEIYVAFSANLSISNPILYLPTMSIKKLNNLPNFLVSIDLPYVFEHEACHMLDLCFMRTNNIEASEQELESRADQVEILCTQLKAEK